MGMNDGNWYKSSYSSGNGENCVEVAGMAGVIAVQDSKDPARGVLRVPVGEWRCFLSGLDVGKLDC
ncbi:hypothetical protein GCM10009677_54110 [Sphaerisporangium rubeum]|uniref:DUF397 domain-containing protein n=1 Tax=Sphaerisporangium rubeum TaxID=321317 RepID=A0A7X0IGH6_9ACTN|nr:DUF397 domain-containing protein [Sphaerisporangium rubeum]MBB6474736.1 hypothetical protein [Sphaerisporangium rubeum]